MEFSEIFTALLAVLTLIGWLQSDHESIISDEEDAWDYNTVNPLSPMYEE